MPLPRLLWGRGGRLQRRGALQAQFIVYEEKTHIQNKQTAPDP